MNERGHYGKTSYIGAASPSEPSRMSAGTRAVVAGGLLLLVTGIPIVLTAKEIREDKKAVQSRAKHKSIWEQANPDLPYWPADVPPEKQSKWLATRQAWEAKHPEQGHLPWQGQLGIRVPK